MHTKTVLAGFLLASSPVLAEEDKTFKMDGEFGLIITTGNTETTSVTAGITGKQELEKWTNDFILEGLYREETVEENMVDIDRVSAQRFFTSGQANYKLENPDNRLFGFASYENDRLGAFDYQATLAAGWSQKVLTGEIHKLEYSIGPGYAWQRTQEEDDGTGGEDADTFVVRGAASYSWQISDTAKFTQTVATEIGAENTKSRAETALTAQINGSLSMRVSFNLLHNTQVAAGREKLDTESAVTLVYTFF